MQKLKTILQFKYLYLFLFLFISIYVIITTVIITYDTKIKDFSSLEGVVTDVVIDDDKISFIIKNEEKIKCTYYLKKDEKVSNLLGKRVKVFGKKGNLYNNTIPNTFNYKKYLYNNKIYTTYTVEKIIITKNENIFYKLKNSIIKKINTYDLSTKTYLNLFILGDKAYLDDNLYNTYRINGIWHLFAISGMHIGLLIVILNKILKNIKIKNIIVCFILLYFTFLVGFSPSVLRAVIFYIIKCINNKYNIDLSNIKILLLTAFLILIFNPFMIYNLGFQYSFLITLTILLFSNKLTGLYIIKIFKISILSLIVSLPLTINTNYEINLLSMFLNILFVPFISLVIFPISILTFLLPQLEFLLKILINILEISNKFIYNMRICLIIPKMSKIIIIIYYFLLYLYYLFKRKVILIMVIFLIYFNIFLPKLDSSYYIYYLDVKQGDSSILISPNKKEVILIDTGGLINSSYHIASNTLIFLKSLGISKIDLLILSHGDSDHCKDATYIIDNFNVKNVILNNGNMTNIEKEIMKKGHIVYNYKSKLFTYYNIKEYYSENENNSSIITYFNINSFTLLYMGDAQEEEEKYLLEHYNLKDIDILKVGHHGSKSSSTKEFISQIRPKYAIISVGKNNIYGHPNMEVLENLSNSEIYRTDIDGSIEFKIKNNKMMIKTYKP